MAYRPGASRLRLGAFGRAHPRTPQIKGESLDIRGLSGACHENNAQHQAGTSKYGDHEDKNPHF
jgi:hypothetical protein